MLNTFRQGGFIQAVMGGVILLIIVAFALEARGPKKLGKIEMECAVQVGDRCVNPRDFMAAFQLSVRPDLTPKEIKRLGLRKMILDGLVERELLLQEAKRLGISISSEKVDEELSYGRFHFSLPADRDGQLPMMTYVPVLNPETEQFSFEMYQRMVRNYARMSTKDFKVYQTDELVAARMRDLAKLPVRVSDAEVFAEFENDGAKATVRVAQLDRDWFARFAAIVDDDAVRAYITAHMEELEQSFSSQADIYTENCPLISEIFFSYPPAADEEDEKQTRALAERVAAEAAKSPGSFGLLARMYSQGPSGPYDGKKGCLVASDSENSANLMKAIEGLQPGQLSALVPTTRGIHLMRLEQRLSKDDAANVGKLYVARPLAVLEASKSLTRAYFEALKTRVTGGQTMQEAVDALSRETLAKSPLAALMGPKAAELTTAALESRERPQVDVSPSFSRGGVTSPVQNALIGASAKQLAFNLKQVGDVYPEPIDTIDGMALIQLKDKEQVKRDEFDKNKAEYLSEYKARAESEALSAFLARLRKDHEKEIRVNDRFLDPKTTADDS